MPRRPRRGADDWTHPGLALCSGLSRTGAPLVRKLFVTASVLAIATIGALALRWPGALWALVPVLPVVGLGVRDMIQM